MNFKVVDQLIPDLTTMMFKEVGHGEEDRVIWNFIPVNTAWKDHMLEYNKLTNEQIEEQLLRFKRASLDKEATAAAAERTVCICTPSRGNSMLLALVIGASE